MVRYNYFHEFRPVGKSEEEVGGSDTSWLIVMVSFIVTVFQNGTQDTEVVFLICSTGLRVRYAH